ncbi:hypothetical protein [Halococcus saccharolyticus]|uniref:CARDB domain-containing protein n=1 Tax=Halococcus saccharolyticus DSM 5350 TaxID=1227455 RepID=M0MDM5_9EURY|nr:hypothetical protein [Halococcus saccharolyticus]EMA43862.1 hypothetical protein C449_12520 [Halococcus saccharolyticus DSM 5350]
MPKTSWRHVLVAAMVVLVFAFGGCLTLEPSITTETSDSSVFDGLSATEPWTGSGVRVNATLRSTGDAGNVTQITVIKANGRSFQTIPVDPGQTTVIFTVPANQNSSIVASNTANSTTIETVNVTADGNEVL